MKATIQIVGQDLLCRSVGPAGQECRIDGAAAPSALQAWAARYDTAVRRGDEAELFSIGRAMFDWLNPSGWAAAWAKASGTRELEILVAYPADPAEPLARALLEAPWELLAREGGYLADDAVQLFELFRRIGTEKSPAEARHCDLQLMFMAAAPQGENPLAFEDEEAAILNAIPKATRGPVLHLVVEESGCAQFLGERLAFDGPFDALHLSCHGDVHPKLGPVLALEDETGHLALADVDQLVRAMGDVERMPLVFLSACRTAEQVETGGRATEPFVRELVRAGVANVLGWDGSVYDLDAQVYACSFYGELASMQRVPRAAAVARQALRKRQIADPREGRHWHLARLYLGSAGGGALAAKGQPRRRPPGGGDQFLDPARGEVPVAGQAEFVGRRRAMQIVLKAYRDGASGVLIHGMGNLGKSSLAYRVSTRLIGHEKVVVFGRYDALTVFDRVVAALPPLEQRPVIDAWRNDVLADPGQLAYVLEALLERQLDDRPILLVVDDLERVLEAPRQTDAITPVQAAYRPILAAVLRAFDRAQTASRLLITSRYRFTLPDGGGSDLANSLHRVHLQPMDETEREKQLRAAARIAEVEDLEGVDAALLQRALDAAEGNPGLQAVLTRPILSGEVAAAREALAAVEHFRRTGAPPEPIRELIAQGVAADEANAIVTFFKRMAFDTYRGALTSDQAEMFRTCCMFSSSLPIPRSAMEAAGQAAGVAAPSAALDRLLGLGLVDEWGAEIDARVVKTVRHVAANPLARPLADTYPKDITVAVSRAALSELNGCWRYSDGSFVPRREAIELARLALVAGCSSETEGILLKDAAVAAGRFLIREGQAPRAYSEILDPSLGQLRTLAEHLVSLMPKEPFKTISSEEGLRRAISSPYHKLLPAELTSLQIECLILKTNESNPGPIVKALQLLSEGNNDHGWNILYQALRTRLAGRYHDAQSGYVEASEYFLRSGRMREWAICRKGLCRTLMAQEKFGDAQRILLEDVLPAFTEADTPRLLASTLGDLSRNYQALGHLGDAIRVSRENELSLYEHIEDMVAQMGVLDRLAGMHDSLGDQDAASFVRTKSGSLRQRLIYAHRRAASLAFIADEFSAKRKADILSSLGLPALKRGIPTFEIVEQNRLDEVYVLASVGDPRKRAIAIGDIASYFQESGDLDEELRIRRELELEALRTLSDNSLLAIALGKIAHIFYARGNVDEAINFLDQSFEFEVLTDDGEDIAQGRYLRASFELMRGSTDQRCIERSCNALSSALRALQTLGRPRGILVVSKQLALAFFQRGMQDRAIQVLDAAGESLEKFGNLEDARWASQDLAKFMEVFVGSESDGRDLADQERQS